MKLKKLAAILLTVSMAAVGLTGCGNSGNNTLVGSTGGGEETNAADNGDTAADTSEDTERETVASGKKGTIEFWTVFTGADGTSMQSIVDAYNATNPDYTVNHRAMEANDLYLKLPLAVQSGQDVPDIAISHVERIPLFQENGFLTDYANLLASSDISANNYNQKAWKMTDINGGHYGVPLDVHSYILYVNNDLYEKYGNGALDDGLLTWDEVEASGDACLEDGIIPIGMAWFRVKFLASYSQLGGILSSDGSTPDFNNDIAAEVLTQWKDLFNAGYTQKEGDATWELFLGGKMLYCPEGAWMYNNIKESGLNTSMYDYPVFDESEVGNWTSSHQFILPANKNREDEKTQAALDFINFVGNNSLEWAKAGQVPASNAIKEDPEFQKMPQAFLADENEELKINDYKYYGYAVEALDTVLPEIFFGRMEIQEGLDQAVQVTKDKIEMGE